jgi:ribosome-associated heat shock protein Hsp15
MRARTDCAELVALGSIRINRQPTGKPHAKLRVGDVLTIPVHDTVRVLRVVSLAARRGPASEARLLYADLSPVESSPAETNPTEINDPSATPCIAADSSAYRAP